MVGRAVANRSRYDEFVNLMRYINLALVAIYAMGSGLWVSTNDTWYRSLSSPSWQPPDWVFGTIWPYNFIVLALCGWLLPTRVSNSVSILWTALLLIGVVTALIWAYQFYEAHNLGIATFSLLIVAVSAVALLILSSHYLVRLWLLLIPYAIWVCLATALSYSYFKLNKP